MKKLRICFIYNPISGARRHKGFEDLIRQNLNLKRFDYNLWPSNSAKEAMKLAAAAVKENFDIIVAVGGDGTVNEIIQGIGNATVILGIIPIGSGNGLARHLEIPLEADKAIKVINNLNLRTIDLASINGLTFASISGLGFDARVANKYRRLKKRGLYGYARVVMMEFFRYHESEYTLSFNDIKITRKALLVSIANSNQFGYNMIIAPTAKPDDGLLDIVILKKFPLGEIPRMIGLLFTGKIDQSSYVESFKTTEVHIARKKAERVNIDGEAIKMGKEIFVRIQPAAIKVIV
jgi:diacylglycerol kinase (ATP)